MMVVYHGLYYGSLAVAKDHLHLKERIKNVWWCSGYGINENIFVFKLLQWLNHLLELDLCGEKSRFLCL